MRPARPGRSPDDRQDLACETRRGRYLKRGPSCRAGRARVRERVVRIEIPQGSLRHQCLPVDHRLTVISL